MKQIYLPEAKNDGIFAFVGDSAKLAIAAGGVIVLILITLIILIIHNKRKGGKS